MGGIFSRVDGVSGGVGFAVSGLVGMMGAFTLHTMARHPKSVDRLMTRRFAVLLGAVGTGSFIAGVTLAAYSLT